MPRLTTVTIGHPGATIPGLGRAVVPRQRAAEETASHRKPSPAPTPTSTMAPWVPAVRVSGRPRDMISGARVFAGLAALPVLTRRKAA